jgi:hypothetical protein
VITRVTTSLHLALGQGLEEAALLAVSVQMERLQAFTNMLLISSNLDLVLR